MSELSPKPISDPIVSTALCIGAVSFAIGFIGPALFSESNLGPLLGIFVTGPLGFLGGALIGIILSARQSHHTLKRELRWLGGIWAGALLFTFASAIASVGWVAICSQFAVFICAACLFYMYAATLPAWLHRWRHFILSGAALTILSSMYLPLDPISVGEARYAFFLDPRFDGSTKVPDYQVHQSMLVAQWLIIMAVVAFPILVDRMSNERGRG